MIVDRSLLFDLLIADPGRFLSCCATIHSFTQNHANIRVRKPLNRLSQVPDLLRPSSVSQDLFTQWARYHRAGTFIPHGPLAIVRVVLLSCVDVQKDG